MYLLECVFMLDHCMCTKVGTNSCRKFPLVGIAHPVEGSLFQVHGLFEKTTLFRGRFLEESRVVVVMSLVFILYNMY